MTAAPLCLGLHITKCAGTSLMTTLRRVLTEEEYYFFSSYHEAWLASRPTFADIVAIDRLRIVFGHYCHESLLSVFADRQLFLFTGLREPLACAVSGYRQVNAVRAQAGRPLLSPRDFLEERANPICAEILRAFPSLAAAPGAPWERARAALSLFDFIYETEHFERDAATIFAVLDIPRAPIARDNVSDARALPGDAARTIAEGCERVRVAAPEYLADDLRLHAEMRPHFGRPWLRRDLGTPAWALDRTAYVATLPDPTRARAEFCARERDFFAHEFDELGRIEALRTSLRARMRSTAAMLERLG